MTTAPRTARRSQRVVVAVAAAVVLVVAASWWFTQADERRVNAACDAYLQRRESSRTALSETDEAIGRAVSAKADRLEDRYFNDADKVRSWIRQWLRESPSVVEPLDHDKDASALDRGAIQALTFVEQGFVELQSLTEKSDPSGVAAWLPEVDARMQNFDDICLSAARSTWL